MPLMLAGRICLLGLMFYGRNGEIPELSPISQISVGDAGVRNALFLDSDHIAVLSATFERGGIEKPFGERTLAVWSVSDEKWVRSVRLEPGAAKAAEALTGCTELRYLMDSSSLAVCTGSQIVHIISAETLAPVRTLTFGAGISDFAIDEAQHALYAVSINQRGVLDLTEWSLDSGNPIQRTSLPGSYETHLRPFIQVDGRRHLVAVSVNDVANELGTIFICEERGALTCKSTTAKDGVAGMQFWRDDSILFVPSKYGTWGRRRDCIETLTISSFLVNRAAFCNQRTGVRYSFATVDERFVIGFTGYRSYNPFTENLRNEANGMSVWNIASGSIIATARLFEDVGVAQSSYRIVAGTPESARFVCFGVGNVIRVYDLSKTLQ